MDKRLLSMPWMRAYLACANDLDRFDFLAEKAILAPQLPAEKKTLEYQIRSCDSNLWCDITEVKGRIVIFPESDALFVKGLALLLQDCTSCMPMETLAREPVGLAEYLFERGDISLERKRGLHELEERVMAFADKMSKNAKFPS